MVCQSCNEQTATIHLTEITEGLRAETHLCEACAQKQGLAVKSQIPINELLSTLLAAQSESGAGPDLSADIKCPSCGMTLKQFAEKSLLGCPHDYDVFGDQLKMIIERAHNGKTRHCGKTPSAAPAEARDRIKLMNLKQQLEDAVRDEDYETAAKVRDMIEKMK